MIEVEHLSKHFGEIKAVDDLSFTVKPGEVLGFLGPNGAGKSTTMKMITGFLQPSAGTARVMGHDIQAAPLAAKRTFGYLPEGAPGYGDMSVAGFLNFVADLRNLHGAQRQQRLRAVVGEVHIEGVLHQKIETLSKGFRRRVGLAQAILHDPQVLILDEPTDGLDPNQKHEVRRLIANMAHDKIVIISTHILEEVEAVCSRALIIAHGKLLADGSPDELQSRSHYHGAIQIEFDGEQARGSCRNALQSLAGVKALEEVGESGLIVLPRNGAALLGSVSELAQRENWPLQQIHQLRGRMDEVFRQITGGDLS